MLQVRPGVCGDQWGGRVTSVDRCLRNRGCAGFLNDPKASCEWGGMAPNPRVGTGKRSGQDAQDGSQNSLDLETVSVVELWAVDVGVFSLALYIMLSHLSLTCLRQDKSKFIQLCPIIR